MYRDILVPLDGSAVGEHALPFAIDIARRADATLHLVHVHALDLSVLADFPSDQALDAAVQEAERAYLATVATRIAGAWSGPVVTALRDGIIAPALHDYALEHTIDLVVMTSHGRGGIARAWLGNIADALVRTLPVPILLVRPQEEQPDLRHAPGIERILVPLDGTPLGEQVLEPALALGGDALHTLTLMRTVEPIMLDYMGVGYSSSLQRVQRDAEEASLCYLKGLAERIGRPDLAVHTRVEIGAPAQSILHYAETMGVDLIALATHGRGAFARIALGSVADKVARGTTLPVLLYHPGRLPASAASARADEPEHAVR